MLAKAFRKISIDNERNFEKLLLTDLVIYYFQFSLNLIIVLGISKQEDVHRAERPLEKTREIDNEVRISKEAEMKRKFNRNQKCITP